MEIYFLRLAVAVVSLVLLIATIIALDNRTRKSFSALCRGRSRRHPVLRSFATAAMLRWF
jgi:hypothetical protein